MRRGVISYSKVRAVTRVATPETEQTLLDVALAGTAAHVEQVVRAWRRVDRTAEAADDQRRHASRVLHTWVDDDGMVVIRGRLTPEVGAVVRRAGSGAGWERRAGASREPGEPDPVDEAAGVAPSFGQRQADALGMVAECALAGGLDRGTAGDRYQVVLHVDAGTLAEDADVPAGTSPPAQRHHPSHGTPMRCPGPRRPGPGPGAAAPGQAALEEAGGIHVTATAGLRRRRSRCGMVRTGRCSTSAARPAPSPPPCAGRWRLATGSAGSPDARPAAAMRITYGTGRMAGRRRSTIWCCSAGGITGRCTRRGSGHGRQAARRRSCGPTGGPLPAAPPAPDWTGLPLEPTAKRLAAAGMDIDGNTATPAWRGERLDLKWAGILWRPRPGMAAEPGVPAGTSGP